MSWTAPNSLASGRSRGLAWWWPSGNSYSTAHDCAVAVLLPGVLKQKRSRAGGQPQRRMCSLMQTSCQCRWTGHKVYVSECAA